MKQIKVEHTRMHKVGYGTIASAGRRIFDTVPVVEGKLVLIEDDRDAKDNDLVMVHAAFNPVSNRDTYWIYKKPPCHMPYWGGNIETYVVVKPIIISENERIEKKDMIYHPTNGIGIADYPDDLIAGCKKVLVLPEQFSPKHLQAIISGKLNDDDKVLIECEEYVERD